jgi:hypothetical protein
MSRSHRATSTVLLRVPMADSESHVLAVEPGFTRKNLSILSLL